MLHQRRTVLYERLGTLQERGPFAKIGWVRELLDDQ